MIVVALIAFFGAALPVALYWRLTRKLEGLEEIFYEARLYSESGLCLRPLAAHEAELVASLGAVAAVTEELRAAGLVVLGDLVEDIDPDRMPHISRRLGAALARRAFASGDGIVFGSCDPLGYTELMSARDGELYVSERSERQAGLAVPPFVSARHFGPGTSLSALLDAHRASLVESSASWARVTSLEQYVQQAQHARLREIAWRDAQDPDALLDLDLRALLGERTYAVIGSELTVRLAARRGVTTARVVSSKH